MGATSSVKEPPERLISAEVEKELLNHPGKWVAIGAGRILAVADNPRALLDELGSEASGEDVILHHVPEDSNAAYFF